MPSFEAVVTDNAREARLLVGPAITVPIGELFRESTCGPNCDCSRMGRSFRLSGFRAEPGGAIRSDGNMGYLVDHGKL